MWKVLSMTFISCGQKMSSRIFFKYYPQKWENLWLTKEKTLVVKINSILNQKTSNDFCIILWLATVLSTVMLATTVVSGTGFKKSLLGKMCIDYCNDVLQDSNMKTMCRELLKNKQNMWFSEYLWCFQQKNQTFWTKT